MTSPNTARLVLIRHAQSVHSAEGRLAGVRTCSGLTERGRGQALELASYIRSLYGDPDSIDCSPVERARETARIVRDSLHLRLPIKEDSRLTEPSPGVADGLTHEEYDDRYGAFDLVQEPDRPFAPEGESWNTFLSRISSYASQRSTDATGVIWVFTHAGFMVWLLRSLFGSLGTARYEFENCATVSLEIKDGIWTLSSYITLEMASRLSDTRLELP